MQRLGWQRFNLCAHDYGGFIGLGYAIRHPDRVQRLALLNTRAHGIFRPWFYRLSLGQSWIATHPVLAAPVRRLPLAALHRFALARYRKLGCFDTAIEAEYLRATLARLRGADHYVMEERPREVTDALLSLLRTAPAANP